MISGSNLTEVSEYPKRLVQKASKREKSGGLSSTDAAVSQESCDVKPVEYVFRYENQLCCIDPRAAFVTVFNSSVHNPEATNFR
jgi:hypothetical protein